MTKRVYSPPLEVANATIPAGYLIDPVAGEHNTYVVRYHGDPVAKVVSLREAVRAVTAHKRGDV